MQHRTTTKDTATSTVLLSEMDELGGRLMAAARSSKGRRAAAMFSASAEIASARARLRCDLLFVDAAAASGPAGSILEVNGLVIDASRRTVMRGRGQLRLTPTMFDLLWLLAGDPTRVLTKREIYKAIWNGDHSSARTTRTVDSHVYRLRAALGGRPWLHSRWGVGVSLLPPEMSVAA